MPLDSGNDYARAVDLQTASCSVLLTQSVAYSEYFKLCALLSSKCFNLKSVKEQFVILAIKSLDA